jgi:hypothetical protein
MTVTDAERLRLEDYNVAIQNFYDSLTGLDSVVEEARLRCEEAHLACKEAQAAYEVEKVKGVPSHFSLPCPERAAIEEQYRAAVIAFGDAVDGIRLPPRITHAQELAKIEQARTVSNSLFKTLEDHDRTHRCRKRATERATGGSA